MTLEVLPFFLLGLFTQVVSSLQKASAHHTSSGMQTPFPDVELQINYLYTSMYIDTDIDTYIYMYHIDRQIDNFSNLDRKYVRVKECVRDNLPRQKTWQGLKNTPQHINVIRH